MPLHWTQVKAEIEAELDAVWLAQPEEVARSRAGYFPSGAGSARGTSIGNLYFQLSELQGLGPYIAEPLFLQALDDDAFGTEQIKRMFLYTYRRKCMLLGGGERDGVPCPWLNLPKVWLFYQHIVESFDTIEDKADLKDLLWSWFGYLSRMYRWFHTVFPWEVCGGQLPCRSGPEERAPLHNGHAPQREGSDADREDCGRTAGEDGGAAGEGRHTQTTDTAQPNATDHITRRERN